MSGVGYAALPDVPVNDLARDPDDSTNTLYAATDLGVYTTTDGGATWSNATAPLGLPNVECTSIKVVPGANVQPAPGQKIKPDSVRFHVWTRYLSLQLERYSGEQRQAKLENLAELHP